MERPSHIQLRWLSRGSWLGRSLALPLRSLALPVLAAIWLVPAPSAHAGIPVNLKSPSDNAVCLGCHDHPGMRKTLADGTTVLLHVDPGKFSTSVHSGRTCTDCHADIKEIPHRHAIERVNCGRCHYVEEIQGVQMPKKPEEYLASVHRKKLMEGNRKAPTCQNCHGNHDIVPPTDPTSPVHRENVPKTCGACHIDAYADYRESIHGTALARGNKDVPVCTDCHGEHSIKSPKNPASSVYPTHIPGTCSKCHASDKIIKKNRLPEERLETYRDSYHGVANKFGSTVVADCSNCHTAHDIRPSSDPKSSVNKANLPHTCGKCHKGANANFARGKIHVIITKREESLLFYVSNGFKWLTILTMTALVGHIALDLAAKYRKKRRTG